MVKPCSSSATSNVTHISSEMDTVCCGFWNSDIRQNIEGVLTVICGSLEARESPPPLTPPHRKRGEGRSDAMTPNPFPQA